MKDECYGGNILVSLHGKSNTHMHFPSIMLYQSVWWCGTELDSKRMKLVRSSEFQERNDSLITFDDCCSVFSVGLRLQLREVIRIPLGFDLGGCSVLQCVLKRKVDVGVVLMLFCKPGLRPGFSWIDDITVVPFLSYLAMSFHSTLWSFRAPQEHSLQLWIARN